MADVYARTPKLVTALQWLGGETAKRTVELFVQPAVIRYQPDGNLIVSKQDGTLVLHPTDWVLEDSQGVFSTLTNAEFQANFAPQGIVSAARRP